MIWNTIKYYQEIRMSLYESQNQSLLSLPSRAVIVPKPWRQWVFWVLKNFSMLNSLLEHRASRSVNFQESINISNVSTSISFFTSWWCSKQSLHVSSSIDQFLLCGWKAVFISSMSPSIDLINRPNSFLQNTREHLHWSRCRLLLWDKLWASNNLSWSSTIYQNNTPDLQNQMSISSQLAWIALMKEQLVFSVWVNDSIAS